MHAVQVLSDLCVQFSSGVYNYIYMSLVQCPHEPIGAGVCAIIFTRAYTFVCMSVSTL